MTMERPAPPLTERTAEYWRSGADGVLRISRCHACGQYLHPPRPVCSKCRSFDVGFEPVSGKATVYSWTINRYAWNQTMTPPYVIAQVELVEQPGLLLMTNIVDCEPGDVRIGMPVKVKFVQAGEAYIPVFGP